LFGEDVHIYIFDPWETQSKDKFCGLEKVPFETNSALPFSSFLMYDLLLIHHFIQ